MPYFSSFVAKSWLNYLEDIGQGQRSLCMKYPPMLVIICAQCGKNLSRKVRVAERTQNVGQTDGWTDGPTDGRMDVVKPIYSPNNFTVRGIMKQLWQLTPSSAKLSIHAQIAKFLGPTWVPPGSCQPQMGPMLAPWTLLSGWLWDYIFNADSNFMACTTVASPLLLPQWSYDNLALNHKFNRIP